MRLARNGLPEKPEEGSSETFPKELGMQSSRKLGRDCADFYVLERLTTMTPRAHRALSALEKSLSREFSLYLDMAVGGELRHAAHAMYTESNYKPTVEPEGLANFLNICRHMNLYEYRTWAWMIWTYLRQKHSPESIEWIRGARAVFGDENWPTHAAGGLPWASVCKVEYDWLTGRLIPRTFVDRCFTIEHNHGAVFDKVYSVSGLKTSLRLQAEDKYPELVKRSSGYVQELWYAERRQARQEYDPSWLGVQEEWEEGP